MAYEIEALTTATEAFARDVADQLEKSDEGVLKLVDCTGDIVATLVNCQNQSMVNEALTDGFGEALNHDPEAMVVMAGAIDFFWQIYNDTAENPDDE